MLLDDVDVDVDVDVDDFVDDAFDDDDDEDDGSPSAENLDQCGFMIFPELGLDGSINTLCLTCH